MRIVLYGVGKNFREVISDGAYVKHLIIDNKIDIVGISDKDEKKIGQAFKIYEKEYVVRKIEELQSEVYDKILVSSRKYFDEIKNDLLKINIPENKIEILDVFLNQTSISTYKKYKLSLVLIIKNEAQYVSEWIEYHLLKGVEHFYIYDDGSTDGLQEVLETYISIGIVTYHLWKHELGQPGAYFDAVKKYKFETKYMGFIDTDEFLVTRNQENIYDVIEEIRQEFEYHQIPYHPDGQHFGGLGVNFKYFGTSGHRTKPNGLVIENFIYHANDKHPDHSFIKSIVNPRVIVTCDIHHMTYIYNYTCISENGSIIPIRNFMDPRYEKIWINHYWCKSEEEMFVKLERGWIDGRKISKAQLEKVKGFNEIFDNSLLKYTDKIKEKIDERKAKAKI